MSKEQVEKSEQEMFENFLDKIYEECKLSELSYFERNLEVMFAVCLWRVNGKFKNLGDGQDLLAIFLES